MIIKIMCSLEGLVILTLHCIVWAGSGSYKIVKTVLKLSISFACILD